MLQEKYDLIDELLGILEQLIAIYTSLKVSNDDKQRVLAAGNLADLQMIAQQEEEIVAVIAALEERRSALQGMIDSYSHTSLTQLIDLLQEPRKQRGIALAQELRQLVKDMSLVQESNSIVLRNFLKLESHKRNILFKVSTVPEYGGSSFASNNSIFNKII